MTPDSESYPGCGDQDRQAPHGRRLMSALKSSAVATAFLRPVSRFRNSLTVLQWERSTGKTLTVPEEVADALHRGPARPPGPGPLWQALLIIYKTPSPRKSSLNHTEAARAALNCTEAARAALNRPEPHWGSPSHPEPPGTTLRQPAPHWAGTQGGAEGALGPSGMFLGHTSCIHFAFVIFSS